MNKINDLINYSLIIHFSPNLDKRLSIRINNIKIKLKNNKISKFYKINFKSLKKII